MKLRTVLVLGLSAVLAGCASLNDARNKPPKQTWVSHKSVDELASCMIPVMNKQMIHKFPGDPDIRHVLQTTMPNKVYEIQPQQPITIGAQPYFVTLTKLGDGDTKVEAFAILAFSGYVPKVAVCI